MKLERPADWHGKRAALLQEACEEISKRVGKGVRPGVALKQVSALYHERPLTSTRRLRIAPRTLGRIWRQWKRDGCKSSSFELASRFTDKTPESTDPAEEEKRTALKIKEAAYVMGMTPRKVRHLIQEGKLPAIDVSRESPNDPTSKKRHFRVPFRAIERYFAEQGLSVPVPQLCLRGNIRAEDGTTTLTMDSKGRS